MDDIDNTLDSKDEGPHPRAAQEGDVLPEEKKLKYEIIFRDDESARRAGGTIPSDQDRELYRHLDSIVAEFHADELCEARIALAYWFDVKEDQDGHIVYGRCRKVGELDRQLHGYDVVILLNYDKWQFMELAERAALLDHELCHARLARDTEGNAKEDVKGRKLYRLRKHDIEEFYEIIDRRGQWARGIEERIAQKKAAKDAEEEKERLRRELAAKEAEDLTTPFPFARKEAPAPVAPPSRAAATAAKTLMETGSVKLKGGSLHLPADPVERAELEAALKTGAQDPEKEPKRATRGRARAASDSSID